jgi:alpha/beta superfamily hydrolase
LAEQRITIPCGSIELEALADLAPSRRAAVITHPHPLYGGDMYNNVVAATVAAYRQPGFRTLRFNFRGVGRSGGEHGDGEAEQQDVAAALSFLEKDGADYIDLAGYSFGAWVNACGIAGFTRADRLVMVAPPVKLLDFSGLGSEPRLRLVIVGSHDDFAPVAEVERLLPVWNAAAELVVIDGADHFFWDRTDELQRLLAGFLERTAA